jgi:predicted transcriptional regulator
VRKDGLVLVITIGISLANSIFSIVFVLLILTSNIPPVKGSPGMVKVPGYSVAAIPISTAALGWLIICYELISHRKNDISKILRKRLSEKWDNRALYDAFRGRGGPRRLSIMESLGTPKMRNEIAQLTGTDWKEVDRNIRILESIDLVRIQYNHGTVSVYELTGKGKEFLNLVETEI